MDEGAKKYLMELEKARLREVERGGTAAGTRLVESQKAKARYLAGDDDKQRTVNAARTRLKNKNKAAGMFEAQSRARNQAPTTPKKQQGGSSNPRSQQKQYQKGKGDSLFGDFFSNLAKPFQGDGKSKPKNNSSVYEARRRAASGGK